MHTHTTRRSWIASFIGWAFGLSAITALVSAPSIGTAILVMICVGVWAVHHPRVSKKLAGVTGRGIRKGTKHLAPALKATRGGDA